MKISQLINMKMPTIVGIFIFVSRENFMLSCVEHEKRFITSGPGRKRDRVENAVPRLICALFISVLSKVGTINRIID